MDSIGNYRSPILNEPQIIGSTNLLRTPQGNVRSTYSQPPPLPPPVYNGNQVQQSSYGSYLGGMGQMGGYGGMGGGYNSPYFGGGSYGGYGGIGSYGGYGGGGAYGGYGGFGSYGSPFINPHDRFIQMAEENTRPAFESIESVVSAVANIASMLNSTFFAITSSFRAMLGVAANFGRLSGVFSQFWHTFALFRGLTWLYKKLLYWLRISNYDPSTMAFKEAFAAAQAAAYQSDPMFADNKQPKAQSPWPIVVFLGFIFTAPYLVMKLLGNLASSAVSESQDPRRWIKPIKSTVIYDFQARNQSELNIKTGQAIFIAPKEIQNTQKLLNTGWALGTIDGVNSGLVPITYVQRLDRLVQSVPETAASTTSDIAFSQNETQKLFPEYIENNFNGDEIIHENDKTVPIPSSPGRLSAGLDYQPEINSKCETEIVNIADT